MNPDSVAGRADEKGLLQPLGGEGKLVVEEVEPSEVIGGCRVRRVAGDGSVEELDGLHGRRSWVDGEAEVGLGERLQLDGFQAAGPRGLEVPHLYPKRLRVGDQRCR